MAVKLNTGIRKASLPERIRKAYFKAAKAFLERKILSEMLKGKSPVKGGRWDAPYSDSYKRAIKTRLSAFGKRQSPVNLKLSGQLHASLNISDINRKLVIVFNDFLADIHNRQGASKKKAIRRMLPDRPGEDFNDAINAKLDKILNNIVKREISRINL